MPQVATPTFNPQGGNIYPSSTVTVTISTTTSGSQIRYTLDGSTPTSTYGTLINSSSGTTSSFNPGTNGKTVTAIAFKSGYTDSAVNSADYWSDSGQSPMSASSAFTSITYSVWDGDWAILEEYDSTGALVQKYLQGYHGLVKTFQTVAYYYQDELGSTSHIAGGTGALIESYQYDLYGKPRVYNSSDVYQASATPVVKDLFTGQRWVSEIGLYDDRNRFMSTELGRFLQPDPIGFKGDASNLYRYCGNDWANRPDRLGLNPGDLFATPDAAARDWFRTYNSKSISANHEFASVIYKTSTGKYSYNEAREGTGHDARERNSIPEHSQVAGDIHSHGDYSRAIVDERGRVIGVERISKTDPTFRKDAFKSDHASPSDVKFWHEQGKGKDEYNGYVTTPGNRMEKEDGTNPKSQPHDFSPKALAASGYSGNQPAPLYADGAAGGGTAWGEQTDGSFVEPQGSGINLSGDSCPGFAHFLAPEK